MRRRFIKPDDGSPDVFCHVSGLLDGEGSVLEGDTVVCAAGEGSRLEGCAEGK